MNNQYFANIITSVRGHAKEIGGIGLIILCAAFLLWYMCHIFKNKGRWKIYEPQFPQHIKTWHGYVERSKYERNAERITRYKENVRLMFDWKTTTADYEWMFWDPSGLKRKEHELKREQTFLRHLPRWMRSWEPGYLRTDKYRDVEQGVNSANMFRIELPPHYQKTCGSAQIFSQAEVSHSCNVLTSGCPVMTGALIESCDCPVLHTVRRRKNTSVSPSAWHADSKETSRAIRTQLLMQPEKTCLFTINDVQSETEILVKTLPSGYEQASQRAVSVPLEDPPRLEGKKPIRALVSASTKPWGKMHFVLHELDQNRSPEGLRGRRHNTEVSTHHDRANCSTAALVEPSKQLKQPVLSTHSYAILDHYRRTSQGSLYREVKGSNPAMDQISARGSIKKQWRDYKAEALLGILSSAQYSRQVSMPPLQSATSSIGRSDSENIPSPRSGVSRCASQPNTIQRSYRTRSTTGRVLGNLSRINETQCVDETESPRKGSVGMPHVKKYVRPKDQRSCAPMVSGTEESLQLVLWPHRVKAISTIGSANLTPELTAQTKERVPSRIGPVLKQPFRQGKARLNNTMPSFGEQSGNAGPTSKAIFRPPRNIPQTLPAKDFISRPTSVASERETSRQTQSLPDKVTVGNVHQRLKWLEWELAPGYRQDLIPLPLMLELGDPQPVGGCGASLEKIKRHSSSLEEIRTQSRFYRPIEKPESEMVHAATSMVTAAWMARHSPYGLPQNVSAEELMFYSSGGDFSRTLEDWQNPESPKQPVVPNEFIDHGGAKGPIQHKRATSRSPSVSGIAVKKLRRIAKLNLRRHRRNTVGKAKVIQQSPGVINHFGAEEAVGESTEQEESTATQTPQDVDQPPDNSTLQGIEGPSVSSTLLDDRELRDDLAAKDVEEPHQCAIDQDVNKGVEFDNSQVSKEPSESPTSQDAKDAYDSFISQDVKVPVEESTPHCTEEAYKIAPSLDRQHPLQKFHDSYRSGFGMPEVSSKTFALNIGLNFTDVSVDNRIK